MRSGIQVNVAGHVRRWCRARGARQSAPRQMARPIHVCEPFRVGRFVEHIGTKLFALAVEVACKPAESGQLLTAMPAQPRL